MFLAILLLNLLIGVVLAGNGNGSSSGSTLTTNSPTSRQTGSPTSSPTGSPTTAAPAGCVRVQIQNMRCSGSDLLYTIVGTTDCPTQFFSGPQFCVVYNGNAEVRPYITGPFGETCTPSTNSVDIVDTTSSNSVCLNNLADWQLVQNMIYCSNPSSLGSCPSSWRRLLTAANDYQEHQEEIQELAGHCGSHNYDASIFVNDHIFLKATPSDEASAAGCPAVAAHAVFQDNQAKAHKEVMIWYDESGMDAEFPMSESLSVGTFKFSDIVQAATKANPSNADVGGYHVIKNNCGSFALNIAKELGIQVNGEMTSFVARRLAVHATSDWINKIRHGFSSGSKKQQLRGLDDSKLVEMLVDHTVTGES